MQEPRIVLGVAFFRALVSRLSFLGHPHALCSKTWGTLGAGEGNQPPTTRPHKVMPEKRGRNQRQYVERAHKLKAHTRKHRTPCWICNRPIDTTLPPTHARSFTADHIKQLKDGGHLMGPLLPAHRDCNARRGNRTPNALTLKPLHTSKPW